MRRLVWQRRLRLDCLAKEDLATRNIGSAASSAQKRHRTPSKKTYSLQPEVNQMTIVTSQKHNRHLIEVYRLFADLYKLTKRPIFLAIAFR